MFFYVVCLFLCLKMGEKKFLLLQKDKLDSYFSFHTMEKKVVTLCIRVITCNVIVTRYVTLRNYATLFIYNGILSHIRPVVPWSQKLQHSITTRHILMDLLVLDSDMLGPLMEHRVGRDSNRSFVVQEISRRT